VRLRECLVSFIGETCHEEMVAPGQDAPKGAALIPWSDLLANALAAGASAATLRSYLKRISVATWDYVNWLTHAKNAVRIDAEIGLKAVEHLLGVFTAALVRLGAAGIRCIQCASYQVVDGVCRPCGWIDSSYEPPPPRHRWSEAERARRLSEPCTPSSDISMFLAPDT
jgi:hypothetical protein